MASKKAQDRRKWGGILSGLLLIAMGVIFLLNNLGYTSINFGIIWPVFLIIPGIFILFGHHDRD